MISTSKDSNNQPNLAQQLLSSPIIKSGALGVALLLTAISSAAAQGPQNLQQEYIPKGHEHYAKVIPEYQPLRTFGARNKELDNTPMPKLKGVVELHNEARKRANQKLINQYERSIQNAGLQIPNNTVRERAYAPQFHRLSPQQPQRFDTQTHNNYRALQQHQRLQTQTHIAPQPSQTLAPQPPSQRPQRGFLRRIRSR